MGYHYIRYSILVHIRYLNSSIVIPPAIVNWCKPFGIKDMFYKFSCMNIRWCFKPETIQYNIDVAVFIQVADVHTLMRFMIKYYIVLPLAGFGLKINDRLCIGPGYYILRPIPVEISDVNVFDVALLVPCFMNFPRLCKIGRASCRERV